MGDYRERRINTGFNSDQDFFRQSEQIGSFIENRLAVPMAGMVLPQDLAAIGAAVFASTETDFASMNLDKLAKDYAKIIPEPGLVRLGKTREEFVIRYKALVGETKLGEGAIAIALKTAKERLEPQEEERLERSLANLMATLLFREPGFLDIVPGIRLDYATNQVKGRKGHAIFPLDRDPVVVIEYGPGIVGYRKIPDEVAKTPQTIFIEKSRYASQVLFSLAQRYGIISQQNPYSVVTRENGIKAATTELLAGAEGMVDIIMASMIHAAGTDEIQAGFANAERLLRSDGLLVIQAANAVEDGVQGKSILDIAQRSFGKQPQILIPFSYTGQNSSERKTGYDAVFVK